MRAASTGWGTAQVICSLTAGMLLTAWFVWHERRAEQPTIPTRVFASHAFTAGNATMFLLNGALLGAVFLVAQFQQFALTQDPLDAGVASPLPL